MDFPHLHDWTLEPGAAVELQRKLAKQVIYEDRLPEPIREAHRASNQLRLQVEDLRACD